jgi:hypothetical protein
MFEPYWSGDEQKLLLRPPYLALTEEWRDIPACRALAEELATGPAGYHRLATGQLLKHILGLKFFGSAGNIRLLYLYYDAIGDEAAEHRDEIERFRARIAGDPVQFVSMAVQEFITRSVRLVRGSHRDYIDYLSERYL